MKSKNDTPVDVEQNRKIRDRLELLDEQLARHLFVYRMAYGRWNGAMIAGATEDHGVVRGAQTQMNNVAVKIDAVLRNYCATTEPLS
jgi:tRNA A37 threonylcarbamoyltransferase TsaD